MAVAPHELVGHTKPGQRFAPLEERLLDDDLRTLATKLPAAGNGVVLVREFAGGRGVADAVAVTQWQDSARRRLELSLPFLINKTDCALVSALSTGRARSVSSIAERLGMSQGQVVRRLRRLEGIGYVRAVGSGYRLVHGFEPIGHAYALEAKVSDWQKGLSQALRYSTWCDAAAVVLLKPPLDLAEAKGRFSKLGIGLATGGKWSVRPRLGRPNRGLRLAMSERLAQMVADLQPF